jgi:tetratricopeptide (TPR) repeat protein
MARTDWQTAAALAKRLRTNSPASAAGWLHGSVIALIGGDKTTAIQLVREFLAIDPTNIRCLLQEAECLLALGQGPEAIDATERARAQAASNAPALQAIGEVLVAASAHTAGLAAFTEGLAVAPDDPQLLIRRAMLSRILGNFDSAHRDFEHLLTVSPGDPEALKGLVELSRQTPEKNHVPQLKAALAASTRFSKQAATLHYALAKALEDLADYDASWENVMAASRIEKSTINYDWRIDRSVIETIIEVFPSIEKTIQKTTSERPIFIVGLPRTGTTLVDRILGSHSQIQSAGELGALSDAITHIMGTVCEIEKFGWQDFATNLPKIDGPALAEAYLERARVHRGKKPLFTDKQTANFFYCGLIAKAFPDAKIIHVTRHPLAACNAILRTQFVRAFPYSYDLDDLAEFYVGYRRLMTHWHQIMPDRILDIAYETIITDLEAATRTLLNYIGLAPEDACIEFYKTPAAVMTASAVQVRNPIYDTSVDRWRQYSAGLARIADRLKNEGIGCD